ncbi:MAG: T9SS type A sorting domain-containing protein [Flavobacteriales bacterium]|nr:T9SS type A sorting domain-containing protein [Flavobacteriales bacterium]MDG1765774.1 T9SS type A sorting domain-containing protein [Flavobacteriales bacterium]
MHQLRYTICLVLAILPSLCFSQAPFNGLVVEEIPIPPAIAAQMQAEHNASPYVVANPSLQMLGLPRTWRVYACQSDADWELQAMVGLDYLTENYPLNLNTTTSFYQNIFGSANGLRDENPFFLGFSPQLAFDSWLTIGPNPRALNDAEIFITSGANQLTNIFEAQKSSCSINDIVGTVISSLVIPAVGVSPPGIPDANARVLFGQFTSDGIVSGNISFQYRFLNPDGTIYDPPGADLSVVVNVYNVPFDLTPGVLPIECSIQFLPVELVSFDAFPQENDVVIRWETASEKDSDYFVVERSTDLQNWSKVGEIEGAGTSDLHRIYVLKDEAPLYGESYYRLKQFDYNGQSETHAPKTVLYYPEQDISVYPNPAKGRVLVEGLNDHVNRIELINARGQVAKTFMSSQEMKQELDLQALSPGMYTVQVIMERGTAIRKKLIIQ